MSELQRNDTEQLVNEVEQLTGQSDWDGTGFRRNLALLEECISSVVRPALAGSCD